jgi:hypothetical protein
VPEADISAGQLFHVIADTTNLVSDLRVEEGLAERLVCARARLVYSGVIA